LASDFAIKSLKGEDAAETFEREVEALRLFSDSTHPNIVRLLATFEQGDEYHIIFPWAECNLYEYWKEPVKYLEILGVDRMR